jgi:hypothetical protein
MTDSEERWLTALHEAGHVCAALHYGVPFKYVTIEPTDWCAGYVYKMRTRYFSDLIATMAGSIAELGRVEMEGGDARMAARADAAEFARAEVEALAFMKRPDVQRHVDAVARALLKRTTLTAADVRAVIGEVTIERLKYLRTLRALDGLR